MNFTDKKLDAYISTIKDPETSSADILSNYKKATHRINILKTKYNEISATTTTQSSSEENNKSLEELITDLNQIKTQLEAENTDINTILQLYSVYKKLIEEIKTKHTELQNKFYRVDSNKANIVISKINIDELLL